ncbi:MAG: Stf0 family sulfotransferase [Pseudomonadota bacterium]
MWSDYPALHDLDRTAFARDRALPPAQIEYAIFFTPRSGSTWLTDVATRTGQIGRPDEAFNPRFLSRMMRSLNAGTLAEYCAVLRRRRSSGGVFGFEITHHQLRAVFGDHASFRAYFPRPKIFWLIRRDIIAQAVSLYKMRQTRIAHATDAIFDDIAERDHDIVYSPDDIAHWVNHILVAEQRSERLFQEAGWQPMRLCYETNIRLGAKPTLNRMAEHLGLPPVMRAPSGASVHRKIATSKNSDFSARFRAENASFVAAVARQRAPWLKKLRPYREQLDTLSADKNAA